MAMKTGLHLRSSTALRQMLDLTRNPNLRAAQADCCRAIAGRRSSPAEAARGMCPEREASVSQNSRCITGKLYVCYRHTVAGVTAWAAQSLIDFRLPGTALGHRELVPPLAARHPRGGGGSARG